MPIQLLPISLANQIAAGEVVERPASVVKELVENSIDAGATAIELDIELGGAKRIRLRDNGAGIEKDELALALSRHATSKIQSLDDLEAIQSLGFRGEALASISSVSRLKLTSKPAQQETAWQAWVEGRDMAAQLTPAAHPDGTTVDVADLFYNTPARRKFLRTTKTEFGHIDEVVRRIALANFKIALTLRHNQKVVRQYRAATTPAAEQQRLTQVCGKTFATEALNITANHDGVRLHGWIAPAQHCRHQGDIQYFYVNGRMMRDRLLLHAIRQAYGDSLPDDRSASFVLYLELPAQDVDVNVHPAKHEVRFHRARQIHDFVVQALKSALERFGHDDVNPQGLPPSEPAALAGPSGSADIYAATPKHSYQTTERRMSEPRAEGYKSAAQGDGRSTTQDSDLAAFKPRFAHPLPGASALQAQAAWQQSATTTEIAVTQWHLLTVFEARFGLLAQGEQSALGLLDLQRVQCHAQVAQLQTQFQQGLSGQPVLVPVRIKHADMASQLRQIPEPQLARLGLKVQLHNRQGDLVEVQQVPSLLRQTDLNRSLPALVQRLSQEPANSETLSDDFWRALAIFAVQQQYSKTQAEHWLNYWRTALGENRDYLYALSLPALPASLLELSQ